MEGWGEGEGEGEGDEPPSLSGLTVDELRYLLSHLEAAAREGALTPRQLAWLAVVQEQHAEMARRRGDAEWEAGREGGWGDWLEAEDKGVIEGCLFHARVIALACAAVLLMCEGDVALTARVIFLVLCILLALFLGCYAWVKPSLRLEPDFNLAVASLDAARRGLRRLLLAVERQARRQAFNAALDRHVAEGQGAQGAAAESDEGEGEAGAQGSAAAPPLAAAEAEAFADAEEEKSYKEALARRRAHAASLHAAAAAAAAPQKGAAEEEKKAEKEEAEAGEAPAAAANDAEAAGPQRRPAAGSAGRGGGQPGN